MKQPEDIIHEYYADQPELEQILLTHSRQVAEHALKCLEKHPELRLDEVFVREAAMLHDIGIIRCDAPSIHCHGSEPYLKHGVEGATLIEEAIPPAGGKTRGALSRVCARHTGTGLPGLEPETIEEQIICYADKFFSKTKLEKEKTYEEACRSLMKFGEAGLKKFEAWHRRFL